MPVETLADIVAGGSDGGGRDRSGPVMFVGFSVGRMT